MAGPVQPDLAKLGPILNAFSNNNKPFWALPHGKGGHDDVLLRSKVALQLHKALSALGSAYSEDDDMNDGNLIRNSNHLFWIYSRFDAADAVKRYTDFVQQIYQYDYNLGSDKDSGPQREAYYKAATNATNAQNDVVWQQITTEPGHCGQIVHSAITISTSMIGRSATSGEAVEALWQKRYEAIISLPAAGAPAAGTGTAAIAHAAVQGIVIPAVTRMMK